MNRIFGFIASAMLMITAVQCSEKQRETTERTITPPELSDPYLQSFRNKNIKFIVLERIGDKNPRPDTIELDGWGNVINITGPYERENRAYDATGFLVKRRVSSDFSVQYIARYLVRGDTLVQTVREYNSSDWNLQGDTTTRSHKVNFFVLDSQGRVTQEFDDGFGPLMYIYSQGKLMRKEIEVSRNNDEEFHWETIAEYSYYENGEIKSVKAKEGYHRHHVFYFSKGFLDSSQVTWHTRGGSFQDRYKYWYVYY
jgi:hypothetical protein